MTYRLINIRSTFANYQSFSSTMTSNNNLLSNSFQNLSESQQNSLIFKRLCELTYKINQIQEDLLLVKANGVEGRQQLDKVLTIAQPTILNSKKKFEFREDAKILFSELSKYFDQNILPSVKQFLQKTNFLKEIHCTIKVHKDEYDEDGDYHLSNDVRNRLSYLLSELKKAVKILLSFVQILERSEKNGQDSLIEFGRGQVYFILICHRKAA
jgi:hypothetical protein